MQSKRAELVPIAKVVSGLGGPVAAIRAATPQGLHHFSRFDRRCCMIQLRREWGRFSNFSFRTPQRRISAYPARPSG